jgi:hypothetical protein
MGGACTILGVDHTCAQNFGRTPDKERPHGRPSYRWEDNISKDIREISWEVVDWTHLAQYRHQ